MIRDLLASQTQRPRRLRASAAMRALVREHHVRVDRLIQPLFLVEDESAKGPILSMPGISRLTLEQAVTEARDLYRVGIQGVLLFGIPAHKDAEATSNFDPAGIVQRTTRAIKAALPQLLVIADLCNCEYTDHGHCGLLDARGEVDNDRTVDLLVRTARTYAQAGVDVLAPSDMMDGRVGALRRTLDEDGYL
ncbi:MAG: porphobilinogen synthase, partial [Candidatus Eremiobacteraeota bacterium]|nr:porphobilinogen synthase [Candidatus Eremiobacteraeota bacterium]